MYAQAIGIVAIVWAASLMLTRKSKVPDQQTSDARLSWLERIQVIIVCLFAPVFSGMILYLGWKEKLPVMARQSRNTAIVMLLLQIVLGVGLVFIIIAAKSK